MSKRTVGPVILMALFAGCGGGGGTPPAPTPVTTPVPQSTPTPAPTATPPPANVTVNLRVNPGDGTSPVTVAVNMCTTDATPDLMYTYDFGDGTRSGPQPDCRVEHSYSSGGVDSFTVRGCVVQGAAQACSTAGVTVYARVSLRATYQCPRTVATAAATVGASGAGAMAAVDRVVFTARGTTGQETKNAVQNGATWSLPSAWAPNIGTIQSLSATTFALGVTGATATDSRPGC